MRLLLPSFLAAMLLLSACKYDSDVEEIPEFENTFSLNGNQEANRLIAVSDGIIGVGTSDVGGVKHLLLIKTDFSGNLLWQKELESGTEGFGIKLTADKHLILAGTITDENDNRDLLLTKTDQLGNVLWSKHFGGILAEQGKDVIELEGGGFMAIGLAQSFGAGPVSMYVVKTDVNGNEIWSRTFGGEGVDGGSEVIQVNSFEVLLLGFTGSFGAGDRDIYVQSVSIDGDSLASFTYGGSGYEESQAIQRSSDGGYIMSNHSASNEPNHSLLATKLDANGMVVWEKEFGTAQAHEGGEGVLADREGNYVFLGRTNSFGNDEQVYFIKTDVSGTVLEELNFGQEGDQRGNDIIEHDGAYYVVGTSSIGGDSDVLLIKRPM